MTESDEWTPPTVKMPSQTIVLDAASHQRLLVIEGCLPLPVGARIELGKPGDPSKGPAVDGIVQMVRVWGASGPATLVLEVMQVPPGELRDVL